MKENGKEAGLGREGLHGQHGLEKVSGDPEGTPEQRRLARGALHRQTRPGSRARAFLVESTVGGDWVTAWCQRAGQVLVLVGKQRVFR